MKGQDVLLLFKMASLHTQEEMRPEGPGENRLFGNLSEIDLLDRRFTTGPRFTTVSAEPEDLVSTLNRLEKAVSAEWTGWEGNDEQGSPVADRWSDSYSLRALSDSLGISKSEVSNSINRCRKAGLLTNDYQTSLPKVNRDELLNITEYALKYFFPVKPGALTRGIPTGFASPVLTKHLKSAGNQIIVWPDPKGKEKGQAVEPLYKTVAHAVKQDRTLYHYLALVDAIRLGGPRETAVAVKLLKAGMRI
ncbi:hypothetical protein SAMN03159444_03839 [Pseudomonas sp. NFACC02]|uniref:MarR family transcriptional regulator n=1 Tax=Pseudomonas sp. NFACC02 TaxID=1566250 RepID=UPI0008BD04FC|nr:helix-turn-helix domain-containing protein [Pseudomonas sp. NFACC02]SER31811.1 hypothetical protein SAMN03159444_03839 [Pseudomonas sp. NFACC02]